jgi:hypothetical protein
VLADAETETALAGGGGPRADDVAFGAGGSGVPARLVFGVPHVEVVVVNAHGEEIFCSGFDVEVHEVVGVPAGGFELRDEIFVADFGGMAVGFDVVVVLAGALDVHVAGVPVAVFDAGLRTPVGPDAELGVVEPGGEAIGLKRGWSAGEGAGSDPDLVLLRAGGLESGSCSGEESNRLAACDLHRANVVGGLMGCKLRGVVTVAGMGFKCSLQRVVFR